MMGEWHSSNSDGTESDFFIDTHSKTVVLRHAASSSSINPPLIPFPSTHTPIFTSGVDSFRSTRVDTRPPLFTSPTPPCRLNQSLVTHFAQTNELADLY